jgi:Ser/Thr protein kinase RdoA (MazF antagonist)
MTKGGSFKRAVRREARAAGLSYTQALARRERDRNTVDARVGAWHRWRRLDGLADHLWRAYRVRVASVTTLSAHGGGIFRVDLADRPAPWVARIVPPEARAAERLHEDVEILRLLQRVDFPAERGAHPEPVTSYRGQHVLVTGYVDGEPRPNTPDQVRLLADALGKLHSTNLDGATIRDGGAWGHDPAHVGKPNEDVRAAHGYLDAVADRVPPEGRTRFEALRDEVDAADACDGLPEALTTPRTGGPNVLVTSDGTPVLVDWKSGGRGPRLGAVAGLLQAAVGHPRKDDVVDAVIDGYTQHVGPTSAELDRLAGAMRLQPAYYAAWGYWRAVASGRPPDGSEPWWPDHRATDAIAERVVARLTAGEPER